MVKRQGSGSLDRRTLLKATAVAGLAQIAAPAIIAARGEANIKIGLDNPLTGPFAAVGKNELIGCQLAVEQINAKGGILGRQVDLLVEDSTSGEAAVAVQKANKLIERDQVNFLLGNINSALAQAMANVSFEKKVFHIVPGGHTDSVTGTQCHWNVFRVCNTTRMETNSVSKLLLSSYGKKWYFITTDYAFGRTLQQGFEASLKTANGTELGADYTPLGTTDFSANLIKAQSSNPDAIILLLAGDDMVNCLKQAVQFGLDKKTHIAGAQQEMEVNLALPPKLCSATGCSSGTGNNPVCRMSSSSSPTFARRAAAMCRPPVPGSATRRPGAASSPPRKRNRSMRWPSPGPCKASSCRRKWR
jgi:branched-chain amino acid transport system substrate-binding protein